MTKIILLKDINLKDSPQVRAEIRKDVVHEYAEVYTQKDNHMPPPVVFKVGKEYIVGDGWHRITAMMSLNMKASKFEVMEGDRKACLEYALGANQSHGIRRTNADKWAAAKLAVLEYGGLSNREIGSMCCVSDKFIAEVRSSLEASKQIKPTTKRVGKNGKNYETKSPVDKAKGEEIKDKTGFPVPEKALLFWKRRDEATTLISYATGIRSQLRHAKANKDLLFHEANFNAMEADLDKLITNLGLIVPHAVCPTCQGQVVEKCRMCGGRGVVSKFRYDTAPEEVRKMRERSVK